jgi:general L-amino acid transport system permease protein
MSQQPLSYVQEHPFAPERPPLRETGLVLWMRNNLFSSTTSTCLTCLSLIFLALVLPPLIDWLFVRAVWFAPDGAACRVEGTGACWAFIYPKLDFFIYGTYPRAELWRVNLTLFFGAFLILWLLWPSLGYKYVASLLFFIIYPICAFFLLHGLPLIGLSLIDTGLWGGILVSLLVSAVGIVTSLPLGILLALGRRSHMPIIKLICIGFIEFVRGVPLITVLFMANTMLPLFVPENWSPDRLLRPLIGVSLFAAAYMAEVVRGGFQAIPRGQEEGALSLGMSYWQRILLIILPQALTTVIPGIVNTFIGLFKDTTLVAIVGIFDFLRTVDTARLDPAWAGPSISTTGYLFAALFYFVFCFGMSRYSLMIERRRSAARHHA